MTDHELGSPVCTVIDLLHFQHKLFCSRLVAYTNTPAACVSEKMQFTFHMFMTTNNRLSKSLISVQVRHVCHKNLVSKWSSWRPVRRASKIVSTLKLEQMAGNSLRRPKPLRRTSPLVRNWINSILD